MTTFKRAIQACGLSQSEAAELLGVSLPTIKAWSRGRNPVPSGVWTMLADLFCDIQDCADFGAHVMETEGIRPEAYSNIEISGPPESELPNKSTREIAGAMALLIAINALADE